MNFSKSPFTDETSDSELLAAMIAGDEQSFAAFDIFYRRYVEDLYRHIFRVKGLLEADRRDLVQEAMLQAFHSAATFKDVKNDNGDAERNRWRTVAWLGQIAARIHYQKFRRQQGVEFEAMEDENRETGTAENVSEKISDSELVWKIRETEDNILKMFSGNGHFESQPRKILREVLEELPQREREILLTTYEEFDLQNPTKQLSREKINEINKRYGISSKNLKQIRYRMRKFVFEECLKRFEASQKKIKI